MIHIKKLKPFTQLSNWLLLLLILVNFPGFAQNILSPEEALNITLKQNLDINIATKQEQIAKNNTHILNNNRLPSVTGNAGATYDLNNTTGKFANGESNTFF